MGKKPEKELSIIVTVKQDWHLLYHLYVHVEHVCNTGRGAC